MGPEGDLGNVDHNLFEMTFQLLAEFGSVPLLVGSYAHRLTGRPCEAHASNGVRDLLRHRYGAALQQPQQLSAMTESFGAEGQQQVRSGLNLDPPLS